jgi:glyoxylase-like metal-dependent hydrolase (beta-lactamase superfamily II)
MTTPNTYRIGDAIVTKVDECTIPFAPEKLFPDWEPAVLAETGWLGPGAMDSGGTQLVISVHSWLVRERGRTILIDTGIGNGKARRSPVFDHLETPYLARLADLGVEPAAVTHVLNTHVHTDHVGWNTRWDGRRWAPTFPNARYIVPEVGHAYFSGEAGKARPNYDMYADSVLPVIEAGQVEFVGAEGGEMLDGFSYEPTPGHSVDHMSIRLRSADMMALFTGDVMHHPVQVVRPDWCSVFCASPDAARTSRHRMLTEASMRNTMMFTAHFPGTSAGTVTPSRSGYHFEAA